MPGRLLLPPNNLGTPDYEIGVWKDFSRDFPSLHKKIEKPATTQENITSIPSPWARLLLFRDALNPEHKLHQKLTSEILDVLEIIFFRNSIIYEIIIKEIDLNSDEEMSRFSSTIRDLNPDKSNFRTIKLLYLKQLSVEQPILLAGSSPYSLFFTPEDKHPKFKRYFKDVRSLDERPEYFRKYIKRLCATVSNKVVNGDNNLSALNDCFSALVKNEPNTIVNFKNAEEDILNHCDPSTSVNSIDIHSFRYDHIESALKIKSSKTKVTPPLVIKNNYRGIYFNNYQFPETIKDLTDFNDRDVLPGEMIKYPWVFPERDFVQDHIIKVPYDTNDDILVLGKPSANESRQSSKYLIPLKDRFFEFFDPIDIDSYLIIEENLGKVELTLKIPIVGDDFIEIKKSFFGADQVIEAKIDDVPYLTVWPKINPEHWKDLYFLIEYLPKITSGIEFYDQDGHKLSSVSPDAVENGGLNSKTIIKQEKGKENNIYSFSYLPDIIQLHINKKDKKYSGLFLIDKKGFDTINVDSTKKVVISVDFGTSNTTIAYQIFGLGVTTSIFESANTNKSLFNYSEFAYFFDYPEEMNAQLNFFLNSLKVFFFPQYFSYNAELSKNEAVIPFSSIVSYQNSVHKSLVMSRANIPFYLSFASNEFKLLGDLKWQTSDQARELTKLYMEQLLLMVKSFLLKKGVANNNVTIIWSYPRSFTRGQLDHLTATWKYILEERGFESHQIKQIDESKASLIYFIKEKDFSAYRDTLKITVDIGGGTSDISAHKANKNLFYSSTLIGGNDLIGEKNQESPFYQFLLNKAGNDSGNNLFINSKFYESAEYEQIDSMRIKFNYIIKKELREQKLNNLVSGEDFNFGRFILLYFYSILFYEIGLKLLKVDSSFYPETFFFGGNGSKFLKWLNHGDWFEKNDNIPFFNNILKSALNDSSNAPFNILLSSHPKSEVAVGSCHSVNDITLLQDSDNDNSQILAENISLGGKDFNWDLDLKELLPDPANPFDFTTIEINDFTNSNIYKFNKTFFELIKSSKQIEYNNDPIINSSLSEIQNDLFNKTTLDQFLRENVQTLYKSTQDIRVSLFVLGAKGCLKHIMKIIRRKM